MRANVCCDYLEHGAEAGLAHIGAANPDPNPPDCVNIYTCKARNLVYRDFCRDYLRCL
eukprot:COSAG05_NODE_12923_length_449_cov_0.582857_1_plen_57_part_01